MGGFNVATVQDNEVKFIKRNMPNNLKAIVVIPNRPMSTQLSRKSLPYKYSKEDAIFNISHSSLLAAAFMSHNWEMLRTASLDKIHQKYRMKQMPELFDVQKTSLRSGSLMSTLSGSGSTLFSICYKDDAQKIEAELKKKFPHFRVLSCNFDNDGIRVED
jgi:homoserine kinase